VSRGARRPTLRELERSLLRPSQGAFGEEELEGLEEPVRRLFRAAIAPGTPLAASARLAMRGRIKLRSWTAFRATEVIAPHAGFVWRASAGPIRGYDRYVHGEGEMRWKLLGLLPVMRATGPDIGRSAAGRLAGEAAWLPTSLLPRFGVRWSALGERRLAASFPLDAHELELHVLLDEQARIEACWLGRWGDPDRTGTHALHPFGMEATAHRTFSGLTIPSAGRAGWHYGTDRWPEGVFFEYELTALELVTSLGSLVGGSATGC
jgi:hypothetical protein